MEFRWSAAADVPRWLTYYMVGGPEHDADTAQLSQPQLPQPPLPQPPLPSAASGNIARRSSSSQTYLFPPAEAL